MTIWHLVLFGIAAVLFIAYDIIVNRRSAKTGKLENITEQWNKAKSSLSVKGKQ